MGAFSNDLETALLDHTLGSTSWAQPTSIYVGLCTTNPTEAAANECNAGTYKRKAIAFDAASGSSITSATDTVTFDQATGTAWGTIRGYALFDSSSAGSMLYYADLSTSVVVAINDTVEFAGAAVVVTLD